ncbi:hypothetical protein HHK36_030002 [Tetracentron sinense]|uniref:Uncharacterized protein n=1 Tax=Tetracentron sinense TaxID=13715 RepID=A0A834YAH7_TETSI|nr:hypothetical protein HHK36_030002 [Tetracentron sinense]
MGESFPMVGGDSPFSYAKNSNPQKEAADGAKAMLITAITENLEIGQVKNSFCIADLGCSIGPNTFHAVKNIIEAVDQKYKTEGLISQIPNFQVFFSDHVSNDFNTLFTTLPSDRQYFAAGVPGSFYGRLFPEASLHVIHSSYALHWLSKVPQEILDENSPAWNKGRIDYSSAPSEVGEAYSAQYAKDMESFLAARAQELVPGGMVALLIPGRPRGTLPAESSLGPLFEPLESALLDMANEGILSQERVDSFNFPIYSPSPEELEGLVERNGYFETVRMDLLQGTIRPLLSAQECRAGFEGILRKHFGSEIIEELFERYAKEVAGRPPLHDISDGLSIGLFVLLKRKVTA